MSDSEPGSDTLHCYFYVTEITAFSDRYSDFGKLNTEILGVSVDSVVKYFFFCILEFLLLLIYLIHVDLILIQWAYKSTGWVPQNYLRVPMNLIYHSITNFVDTYLNSQLLCFICLALCCFFSILISSSFCVPNHGFLFPFFQTFSNFARKD